jgi:hypothetical protein
MAVIQSSVSVAAAPAVNDNVLSGSQFEFAPFDASLEFGMQGDANAANLRIDVFTGSDMIAEQLVPGVANRPPIYPDDYVLTDVVPAGQRLKIRVRNTGAVASTFFFSVRLTPLH